MTIDPTANPAHRFNELPDETQEFLSQLREDDIETLKDGLDLIRSLRAIGRFMRWIILGVLAIMLGIVALYENTIKLISYWQR